MVLIFASVVTGCASGPALHVRKVASGPLPAGWVAMTSKDGDTSVGVPGGWFDRFSPEGIRAMMGTPDMGTGEMPASNDPQLNEVMQNLSKSLENDAKEKLRQIRERQYAKGILLQAYNTSRGVFDEIHTQYVVQRMEGSGNWSWESAAECERGHYAYKPKRQEVQLPIGKGLKLSADETLRNGSTIHRISYLAIEGKRLYTLRFQTEEAKNAIDQYADAVAQTWRINPVK